METNLKGTIRYDGGRFSGWQRQEGLRTVQGELEAALSRIADTPVEVQGASRTDAGVHALGQVFSCQWPKPFNRRLAHALSMMLKPEIRVMALEEAPPDFNARFSAVSKRYAYSIEFAREPDPFCAAYAWQVPYDTDLDLLRRLLPKLTGRHDFAGFQSSGSQMKTTVRTIYDAELRQGGTIGPPDNPNLWRIEYHGDAFLYKMVRNMTGTLIEIARGRFPEEFLDTCLNSPGPFKGHCAPAHGLTMVGVYYESGAQPDDSIQAPRATP